MLFCLHSSLLLLVGFCMSVSVTVLLLVLLSVLYIWMWIWIVCITVHSGNQCVYQFGESVIQNKSTRS